MTRHHGNFRRQIAHIPVPAGAVADAWDDPSGHIEDVSRTVTWSLHDTADVDIAVQGEQYADGRIAPSILLMPDGRDAELTAERARQLAAALLDAADVLDSLR